MGWWLAKAGRAACFRKCELLATVALDAQGYAANLGGFADGGEKILGYRARVSGDGFDTHNGGIENVCLTPWGDPDHAGAGGSIGVHAGACSYLSISIQ